MQISRASFGSGGSQIGFASAVSVLSVALILLVMAGASLFGKRLPTGVLPWRA